MRKVIYILFFLTTILPDLQSQPIFEKTFGTDFTDTQAFFYPFKDGGGFIAGSTESSGFYDFYIIKLNKDFEIIWSKTYGNNYENEEVRDITILPNGNYLITGVGESRNSTIWLIIDLDGNIIKNYEFGTNQDRVKKAFVTDSNEIVFVGELEGMIGSNSQLSAVKLDGNFNVQWKRSYNNLNSSGSEIQSRGGLSHLNAGYLLLGSNIDFGGPLSRIRLVNVDENGDLIWAKGYHGGKGDDARAISYGNDEGYIIVARSNSYSSNGLNDILVLSVDESGKLKWSKTVGGVGDEDVRSVIKNNDGTFLVSGATTSFGNGGRDGFSFKIDQNGRLIWAKIYGNEKEEIFWDAFEVPEGFILTGTSGDDFFLVKINQKGNSNCEVDVTDLVEVNNVGINVTNESFNQESFSNPQLKSIPYNSIVTSVDNICFTCGFGERIDSTICEGETIKFNYQDQNPDSYLWSDGSTAYEKTFNSPGIFWVDLNFGNCRRRDSIILSEITKPEFSLGPDTTLCNDQTLAYDLSLEDADATYLWSDSTKTSKYNIKEPGNYWLRIYRGNCHYTDSLKVEYAETPHVDLGNDRTLCYGTTINLEETSDLIKWQDGSSEFSYSVEKSGWYSLTAENKCGSSVDSVFINIVNMEDLRIPNVITPNNDDKNEHFIIDNRLLGSPIQIISRWGNIVYEDNYYNNDFSGSALPPGTYFYYISHSCLTEGVKGWIHIIN